MSDFPTYDDLVSLGISAITSVPGSKISEAACRRDGSDVNVMLASQAAMGDAIISKLIDVTAGLVLDTAAGERLDRHVFDLPFPIQRKAASSALATVTFTRPSAIAGAGTIPKDFRFTLGGVTFQTLHEIPFGAGVLSSTGDAQAQITGPEGNVAAGSSGTLKDTLWDTTFVPSTALVAAGGADAESDSSLRIRARSAHETARRGTLGAIEFGALAVDGVTHAKAYETLHASGLPAQHVEVIVSDSKGNSNPALEAKVAAVMDDWRAAGIPVTVLSGTQTLVSIILQMTFVAGVDTQAAFDDAANRIVAVVNDLGPGETLLVAAIIASAKGDGPEATGVVDVKVITPVGDQVPSVNTVVIRTERSLITSQAV